MTLLYQVDLTAQGSQSIGDAGGAVVIDGKTWYAKGDPSQGVQTYTRNLVSGLGLSILHTGGGGATLIGDSNALVHPHFFLPLSQFPLWDSTQALLIRARFAKPAFPANGAALIGLCSSTDDAAGLTSGQRVYDRFVGAAGSSGTTNLVVYKNSSAAAVTNAVGNAGTIANNECIPGIYDLNGRFSLAGTEHLASGMPTAISTWLATTTGPAANVGATPAPNPGVFFGVDCGGTSFWSYYLQALRIDVVGDIADESAPTVTLLSPSASPLTVQRREPVVFELEDETELRVVTIWVRYPTGATEVIYAPTVGSTSEFQAGFTESTVSGTNPRTFTVLRAHGWPYPPQIFVQPVDAGGNIAI